MSAAGEVSAAEQMSLEEAQPPRVGDMTRLRRELFALANNNAAFKRGAKDSVFFSVGEGDRIEDIEEEADNIEVSYNFGAQRERTRGTIPNVKFDLSVVGKHKNTLLPPHIALKEFDMTPEEAATAGGTVTCEAEKKFTFETDYGFLHCCESYVYYDMDGDPISEICSCNPENDEELAYVGVEITEDEEGLGISPVKFLDIPAQHPYFHVRERATHEPLTMDDIEASKNLWAAVLDLEIDFEADTYMRRVREALQVLQLAKRALYVQAGLSPKLLGSVKEKKLDIL
jgi:hypothetical protein